MVSFGVMPKKLGTSIGTERAKAPLYGASGGVNLALPPVPPLVSAEAESDIELSVVLFGLTLAVSCAAGVTEAAALAPLLSELGLGAALNPPRAGALAEELAVVAAYPCVAVDSTRLRHTSPENPIRPTHRNRSAHTLDNATATLERTTPGILASMAMTGEAAGQNESKFNEAKHHQ
jgi:hypothetical protein